MKLTDSGQWRQTDYHRPWYAKAKKLLHQKQFHQAVELGSGAGEFAGFLKIITKNLICLDYSKTYITQLQQNGLKALLADLNYKLNLPSAAFDLAVSLETIEHLYHHEIFLSEIFRILKPGGYLLISAPNIAWWGYRLEGLFGKPPKKTGYHLRFFTYNSFIKLVQRFQFSIIQSAGFSTIPIFNRLAIKLKFQPVYPVINFYQNLLTQDIIFLCQKPTYKI